MGGAGKAFHLARLCRLGKAAHHGDEFIQAFPGFRFRRLDQHGAMDNQGEIHGHRMIPLVDHRLGEIEGGYPRILQEAIVEQGFMHAGPLESRRHHIRKPGLDVIGREHGIGRRLRQAIGTMAVHIGQRPDIHAHLAVEGGQPAETGARRRFRQFEAALGLDHPGQGREGRQRRRKHHRTRPRPAAAMGRGESLVQVDVHGIDTEIARPHPPDDGVEIRPVAIEVTADTMNRVGNLADIALEQPAGIGVGQHDRRDIGAELCLQRGQIDPPIGGRRHRIDGKAAIGGGRRVGAMGAFRHQDAGAGLALAPGDMGGADRHDAAKFAMGTGLGAERHGRHAGQHLQPMGQGPHEFHSARHGGERGQGMQIGKAGQPRQFLVQARVMLHGAGAEGVKPHVDGVIPPRQAHVMAHHLGFRQAGQADAALTRQIAQPALHGRHRRQVDAAAPCLALFKDQGFLVVETAMAEHRIDLGRCIGSRRRGPALTVHHASTSARAAAKPWISAGVLVSVTATTR